MSVINRIGYFKGIITNFAVAETNKAKLPQLVLNLSATALYNEVDETWEDWTEYGDTITAYLILVHLDDQGNVVKCFTYDNIIEAVGWDGVSYSSLAAMDLKGMTVQFHVQEDTYENVIRYKVNSLAAEDAEIGLRKLDQTGLTNLDAHFGVVANKPKTAAKPKSKVKAPPKAKATAPKSGKKRTPPKAPAEEPTPTTGIPTPPAPCTQEEAFEACLDANDTQETPVPAEILDDRWIANIVKIAADQKNVTDEEWPQIRDATLSDIGVVPF